MGGKRIDYKEIEKMYDRSLSDSSNARIMVISQYTVTKWRQSKGYQCRGRQDIIDPDEFMELHSRGYTDKQLAYALKKDIRTIGNYRRRNGIPLNPFIRKTGRRPKLLNVEYRKLQAEFLDRAILITALDVGDSLHDPESLYCDGEFLDKFVKGEVELSDLESLGVEE